MKAIMEVYGALIVLILSLGTGLQVSGATEKAAQAKRCHAEAVSEIENSNFNPGVIDACKKKAAEDGYELEISDCVYDAWQNMRAAQVALKYHYRIPVLGIYEENITYAIAR